MRPLLSLLIGLMLSLPAEAQFGTWVRSLLIGDTTAAPNYDTAFITGYRKNLNISAVTSYKLAAFEIADTAGHIARFNTNNTTQYGAAIDLKWLSVEATFSVPALDAADPMLGRTTSRGLGASYTGRRLWVRAFWNRSTGFYPEQPAAVVQGWIPGRPLPDPGRREQHHMVGIGELCLEPQATIQSSGRPIADGAAEAQRGALGGRCLLLAHTPISG